MCRVSHAAIHGKDVFPLALRDTAQQLFYCTAIVLLYTHPRPSHLSFPSEGYYLDTFSTLR